MLIFHRAATALVVALCVTVCSAQTLVRDLNPGTGDIDAFPAPVGPLTARTCFTINDLFSSTTWVTDGTFQGTNPAAVVTSNFTLGDRIYYLSGGQLRRSLASGSGSEFVADVGLAGFARTLTVGNRTFFSGVGWQGLWVTDGTSAGTLNLRSAGAFTWLHDAWSSGVLFWDGASTFFTDGATTRFLTNVAQPVTLVRGNTQLLEVAGSIVHVDVSSGQSATVLPRAALSFSYPNALCALGARVLFAVRETDAAQQTTAALSVTAGTTAGTTRLGTMSANYGIPIPGTNTALILGGFVHVTDGTVAGTRFVTAIDGPIEPPSVVGSRIVWIGSVATVTSDGTAAGTHLLGIAAQQIDPATNRIYLRNADGGVASFDPATTSLMPVWTAIPGSTWEAAAPFDDHFAFAVSNAGTVQVFVSRGGAPAAQQLAAPGTVINLVAAQARAFLTLTSTSLTTSLYAVDGLTTPSPLFAVNGIGGDLVALGARAQWAVGNLVVSDGTPAGTGPGVVPYAPRLGGALLTGWAQALRGNCGRKGASALEYVSRSSVPACMRCVLLLPLWRMLAFPCAAASRRGGTGSIAVQ